jgi:tRNA pseudouridine38-40 synthase
MATFKLVIEYAGTRYSGWQKQKNALTVAGEMERAIEDAAGGPIELGGAGRTDAGVHALAQVAHLRLERDIAPAELMKSVNARLPADINVLSVREAAPRFHARHHALSRAYLYQVARRRTAFAKRYVWWVDEDLDVAAMRAAASACVGEHDFALFCDRPQDQDSTHVRVDRAEVVEHGASGHPSMVLLRFEASHFLWRQVRRLTGTLVQVGRGTLGAEEFARMIAGGSRSDRAGSIAEWTAPASGLFLEAVRYPGDPALPALWPAFPIDRQRS